jgi:outer membrane immunogenic protein
LPESEFEMRCWSTAVFAAIAVSLIAPPQPALAEPATPYNWTGFHAGGNVGWMWSKVDTTAAVPNVPLQFISGAVIIRSQIPSLAVADTTRPHGVIGGVQLGYDWQGASNWIAGFEADIQASGQCATSNPVSAVVTAPVAGNLFVNTSTASHTDSVQWLGTVRGRLGYPVWPGLIIYGTGGLAYGRISASLTATQSSALCLGGGPICIPGLSSTANGNGSAVKTGWAAGGGIAGTVPNNPHLTWKVEYLHVDLGSINFSFNAPISGMVAVSSKFTDDIVRVGADYHF